MQSQPASWNRPHLLLTLLLGALLVWGRPGFAEAQGGTITGRLTATTGQPVNGAQLVLEEIGRGTLSRTDGTYRLENVPPGNYTLAVRMLGYRPATATVGVAAGQAVERSFVLEQDLLNLQEVVVTASRAPRQKLETSTAITTVPEIEIQREQPRSTADLLRTVPGFYVESSGGEVGGNLFARGLPADGSFRYVALMEDGMPVFDATELFFVNADIFVRVDENIERLEAVRGGSSALFGSNAPGGVINFISKTGGPERAGVIRSEIGTDGLARLGGNVNGPAGDDWRYSVGGFYRYDQGVRDPGDFPASNGGQIRGNVTRLFDGGNRGMFRLSARYLDDRNIFYLPLPLRNPQDPEFVPGFPSTGTLTTSAFNDAQIPLPGGSTFEIPLEDGQRQRGAWVTGDLALELGSETTFRTTARYMSVDHTWNALLPFGLVSADQYADRLVDATPGAGSVQFSGAVNPENGLLNEGGLWHVDKPMSNLSGLVELQRRFGEHQFTVGSYAGRYSADNTWYFNNVLTDVRTTPNPVDVRVVDAGGKVLRQVTRNGFSAYLPFYVNADGEAALFSVYAGTELQATPRLRFDLGARWERDRFEQAVENTATSNLGLPGEADDNVLFGTGSTRDVEHTLDDWAASAGANFLVTDQVSTYGRVSRGYKMPILDNYLFATDPSAPGFPNTAETLWQVEGGVKVASPWLGLSAVAYWLQLSDFPSQDARVVNGQTTFVTAFVGQARTIGAELEAVTQPLEGLRLTGTATLQNPEYTDFVEAERDLTGNRVRRIPEVLLGLDAMYRSPMGVAIGAEWNYVGERFANNGNTIVLPDYAFANGRLEYELPRRGVMVTLGVLNAFNSEGLTEGNPRVDEQLPGQQTFFLARPILPRRVTLSAAYRF